MTKLEIYKDVGGSFRWRLKARNGEIVAISEAYVTKNGAIASARNVKMWASAADIYDLT